jgi:hypothetical protein
VRKLTYILCLLCLNSTEVFSQTDTTLSSAVEQQLENLTETDEAETEDDTYLQSLMQFRRNKLNLNTAVISDLRELKLLNDLQIESLIRYRQLLGNLINIYELQSVPTWDLETIQKVLPYVRVDNSLPLGAEVGQRFTGGRHTILLRGQQILENTEGFTRPDSITNRYIGSRQRVFFRYKYSYRNLFQYGIVGDKDAGEQFFKGQQNKGFDFYSFHLFARRLGIVKALALGDFTVNLGQGLIHWQSLAFKKGPDVTAVKRQADVLRPYNSAGEYNFQRGVGITLAKRSIEFTAFASLRNLDATVGRDTFQTNEDFVSSILNSGYHRTPTEIQKKNAVQQTSFGGNLSFNKNSLHLGLNGVAFKFSDPIQKDIQPYNQFAIQGDSWHNYSLDYSYTFRNVHFFGEAAMDKTGSKAFVNGLLASLHQTVDASLVYRNIEKSYQTLYGNAFTESTFPNNEKGLFTGLSIKPSSFIKIDAYADVFSFPWLRFRVDAPSQGTDYFVQLTYRPNKQTEVYTRYRNESKSINLSGLELPTRQNYNRPRQDWRTQISYKVSRAVSLRNRIEVLWYDPREEERAEQGFLTYFDIIYKPLSKPVSLNARLQYFETDGFDSRIYTFENDVLYSYSIPSFSDKGFRYYFNVNLDLTKKLTFWARLAQTVYDNKAVISSGLDEIKGNKRTEVKLQFQYAF